MPYRQIEYLIQGSILPFSVPFYKISNKLILERVIGEGYHDATLGKNSYHVRAFLGVESDKKGKYFQRANDYLTLFLHLYTLDTGQPYARYGGNSSIGIPNLSELGVNKVRFHGFNNITFLDDPRESDLGIISRQKAAFLELESEYENLMISPLGLSLQFFYDAIMSNVRWRLELAVVNFMIAAETLVITENKGVTQLLSKRIGVLASDTPDEIDEVYGKMKQLYGVRCGIVHGGVKKASSRHVSESFRPIRKAIQKCLLLRHIPKTELIEKLDLIYEDRTLFNDLNSNS